MIIFDFQIIIFTKISMHNVMDKNSERIESIVLIVAFVLAILAIFFSVTGFIFVIKFHDLTMSFQKEAICRENSNDIIKIRKLQSFQNRF